MSPIAFIPSGNGNYFSFKLNSESLAGSIENIRASYQKSFPGNPFEYQFLEESKKKAYEEESNYTMLFTTVSFIAILIALLGILGLMTFMLEQRTKEVGIRRVLGGTIQQIMMLFGRDFILLTMIAAIIASPVSVLLITRWLEGFPYRIDLSWSLFVIAPFIAVALSMTIVFLKVYRSTAVNPSELLRVE
jgi:putative ABC transport system permease protein